MDLTKANHVLAQFDVSPKSIERLNTSGFSGAIVWQITDQHSTPPMDSVAYDLSRLASTWGLDDGQTQTAINAYSRIHPLEPAEQALILLLTLTSDLLMPLQWMDWLPIQKRSLANTNAVEQRLVQLTKELQRLAIR